MKLFKRFYLMFFKIIITRKACIVISCSALLLLGCRTKKELQQDWIEATGAGRTLNEAETDARLKMIEWGLGSYIESESLTVNAQSRYRFISSYTSGYLHNFSIIKTHREGKYYSVEARGQVNIVAVGDAFNKRMQELGHPRVVIYIFENIMGKRKEPGKSSIALKINQFLNSKGYKTKDIGVYGSLFKKGNPMQNNLLENSQFKQKLLNKAIKDNVEVLVLGDVKIVNAGPVKKGSSFNSYQGNLRIKIINAGNGDIIASIAPDTIIQPDVADAAGAGSVIEKGMRSILPEIERQIEENYKSGGTHSVFFKGVSSIDFTKAGIAPSLKKIRGVNSVIERGNTKFGNAVDVECFLSVPELKNAIVHHSWRFGEYELADIDFTGSRIFAALKKRKE
ncbi:MAG: hypothetical protein OEZ34_08770 [Spirochaetia bacterium]|nr:hypothetical protein [Spirochaetia bacterium]